MKGTYSSIHKKGKTQATLWFHGRVHFCFLTRTDLAIFIRMIKMRYQNLSWGLVYPVPKTFQISNERLLFYC